ncbi:MAG: class I SAM-dependent methyltransferase [Saprospiraceae bacterium]|nr:class I SAM-dependent methyltransferase [Saprospiraceae bacterium]
MNFSMKGDSSISQPEAMRHYYRWHAAAYDATRWSFLFGRKALLRQLPIADHIQQSLLEIGCGTGHNLRLLAKWHPNLRLMGVDVSPDMLEQTTKAMSRFSRRLQLFEQAYGATPLKLTEAPDLVLFSYALTMFNPGWEVAIEQAWKDLKPGGRIAVVDFHDTPSGAFRWWMGKNHVRMEAHLLPFLQSKFRTEMLEICPAWLGLWRYMKYVGQKIE